MVALVALQQAASAQTPLQTPDALPSITVQSPPRPAQVSHAKREARTAQRSKKRATPNPPQPPAASPNTSDVASGPAVQPSMASQLTVSGQDLNARPVTRSGEILEAVPGLIVTQHSGEGKANQYFLRGYN